MSVARAGLSRDYLTGKSAIMLDKSVLGRRQRWDFPI
jgi:hypothetical protein